MEFLPALVGPSPKTVPGPGAVDGFAVDLEPRAHLEEDGFGFFGDGAVGFGAYVEEQVAVFADGVDELVDEGLGVAVFVVFT